MIVRALQWVRASLKLVAVCAVALLATTSSKAEAQSNSPQWVVFSVGPLYVTLSARFVGEVDGPGDVVAIVQPKPCVNVLYPDPIDWYAERGETTSAGWRTIECENGVALNFLGVGSHDDIGFVDMWYDLRVGFAATRTKSWVECGNRTVSGPSDPASIMRREPVETTVQGRCGDWEMTAKISMVGGYSPYQP